MKQILFEASGIRHQASGTACLIFFQRDRYPVRNECLNIPAIYVKKAVKEYKNSGKYVL